MEYPRHVTRIVLNGEKCNASYGRSITWSPAFWMKEPIAKVCAKVPVAIETVSALRRVFRTVHAHWLIKPEKWAFSFIGNSTLRWTLRERPLRDRVWNHIESRQFIGWWRDAISDAMTSSGHTGERAIHSSDFSAVTLPFVVAISDPTTLRLSICTSATASVELCSPRGEVPWSFAAVNRRARVSSLAKTHTVSALSAWGFRMHVKRFMGPQNAKFATISVS